MGSSAKALGDVLASQAQVLRTLGDVTVRQREALRDGRLELLQDLFKEMQAISFSAEALEGRRCRLAEELAKEFECSSSLTALCAVLPKDESSMLSEKGKGLDGAVRRVQAEMQILSSLVDENQRLNGMMAAEWRRLQGMNPSRSGVEFRG
ncbi:flagellar export chaperone FlgN [Aminivibrio sp.]